ncbi:MAG: ABC transporter permease subunit [Thermomicrobiales bacterium]|nr:ABC transporter permease subunit [Thermomicrobiales bacterium]MCO5217472.1 ABC transporter permease subunit [Thermomicrobiales bacterium]MCO5223953.1 ABC transporter permease subunit [Thermomicrobiales bacterium]MCO5226767.1 ABC transporter permease subunit [Thermomicrobiales bacterium]
MQITGNMRRYAWLYVMILPVLAYLALFVYYPLVQGVISSFQETKLLGGTTWVGTQNYETAINTKQFWQVVRNTVLIGGGIIVLGFFPPIMVALALNELVSLAFKKMAQTTVYIPHLFSWVVIAGMWMYILAPNGGIVNETIKALGGEPISFFTSIPWSRFLMIALPIWRDMGYYAIIYLAAITSINPSLYEAARVDGASRFQQTWQITLPLLKPTMLVVFMLNTLGMLRIFDQIFIMRNPVTKRYVDVLMTYVYDLGILQGKIGLASAISVMVLGATLIMTAIVWTVTGFGKED